MPSQNKVSTFPLVLALVLAHFGSASFAQNLVETVVKYTGDQFKIELPLKNHIVFYFAPWCGECKSTAGIWEELAFRLNKKESDVIVAKVDCQAETDLCAYQDISDYPTIKFYKTGGDVLGIRYRGVQDLQSIEQFMNRNIGKEAEFIFGARVPTIPEPDGGLHFLQDENFDEALGSVSKGFVKFCTPWSSKCMDLEPVWKDLAKEFRFEDDFLIGQVDCSMSKSTCNENEVRGYPSLLWIQDGIVIEKYDSKDRTLEPLKKYVFDKLGKTETRKTPSGFEEEKDPTDVISLRKESFYTALEKNQLVFVQYWTAWCSLCLEMDTAWEALAAAFNDPEDDKLKIATVDCVLSKEVCEEQKVDEFPTLNLYRNGKLDKTYNGSLELKDLTLFISQSLDSISKDEL